MLNDWRVGQLVRVTFTDKEFEPGQFLDCQIAGILRKDGRTNLLFNVYPNLYLEDGELMKFLEWEYLESGEILALVKISNEQYTQYTVEWKATIEPLPVREDAGGF
jgi:hypothetical protein